MNPYRTYTDEELRRALSTLHGADLLTASLEAAARFTDDRSKLGAYHSGYIAGHAEARSKFKTHGA